jgi:acyl carrier protein
MTIDEEMNAVFREVCKIKAGTEISDDWEPGNPQEWDSLENMTLIAEIEKAYNIFLEFDDLLKISNWGELKKLLREKTGG